MTNALSTLFGCAGPTLSDWERGFYRETRPWGYILFGRNIETPEQVRTLTRSLREASQDPDAPIFIDQEGGMVSRLKGPHFRHPPQPDLIARLYQTDQEAGAEAAWLNARLVAKELKSLGINANCAPMLDVVSSSAHPFLQKRALGGCADDVIALGKAIALGLRQGGVAPVIKHAPGHGKGDADSHHHLPHVTARRADLENEDFRPFLALKKEAMLMTAHVLFDDLDPDNPGTLSPTILQGLIRQDWGYDGLILTDDINMKALPGTIEDRSRAALKAGCDIICHCNGDRADMEAVARAANILSGAALDRALTARGVACREPMPFDENEASDRLKQLGVYESQAA